MLHPLCVLAFAGPLLGPAMLVAAGPAADAPRWTKVELALELRQKDTTRIDVITAGEKQKSAFAQCAGAADVELCRILVSAVNVAAIIGSSIPQ